jgi:hypothetical protein
MVKYIHILLKILSQRVDFKDVRGALPIHTIKVQFFYSKLYILSLQKLLHGMEFVHFLDDYPLNFECMDVVTGGRKCHVLTSINTLWN